jgi:hypothetical protein
MGTRNLPAVANGSGVEQFDIPKLYAEALTYWQRGEGLRLGPDAAEEMLEGLRGVVARVYEVAFIAAHALYTPKPGGVRTNPERTDAVRRIKDGLGIGRSDAYRACEMVDLAQSGCLDFEKVALPSIAHLLVIVRSDLTRSDWGRIGAWMKRKHLRFDDLTPAALADYCKRLGDDAKDFERQKTKDLAGEDPHEPMEAEVVNAEPVPASSNGHHPEPIDITEGWNGTGPPWADAGACQHAFDAVKEAAFDLARGTNDAIEQAVAGREDWELRAMVIVGMLALERPAERIPAYLTCPRSALVRGLKGIAAMEREKIGVG